MRLFFAASLALFFGTFSAFASPQAIIGGGYDKYNQFQAVYGFQVTLAYPEAQNEDDKVQHSACTGTAILGGAFLITARHCLGIDEGIITAITLSNCPQAPFAQPFDLNKNKDGRDTCENRHFASTLSVEETPGGQDLDTLALADEEDGSMLRIHAFPIKDGKSRDIALFAIEGNPLLASVEFATVDPFSEENTASMLEDESFHAVVGYGLKKANSLAFGTKQMARMEIAHWRYTQSLDPLKNLLFRLQLGWKLQGIALSKPPVSLAEQVATSTSAGIPDPCAKKMSPACQRPEGTNGELEVGTTDHGDSGGPLFIKQNGAWVLIGLLTGGAAEENSVWHTLLVPSASVEDSSGLPAVQPWIDELALAYQEGRGDQMSSPENPEAASSPCAALQGHADLSVLLILLSLLGLALFMQYRRCSLKALR